MPWSKGHGLSTLPLTNIRTVERIRRLVDEPLAHEERVVLVEPVVLVDLKQRARHRQVIAAQCVLLQSGWILPHPERLGAIARDVQATKPTMLASWRRSRLWQQVGN